MPCGKKNYATWYNFGPSLTIIVNDGNPYFEKKMICPKISIVPHVIF
jgi:hypothetical protein